MSEINKMTPQEIFDAVWNGLKSQNFEKSVNGTGKCMYRGDGGRKCAAGWLISDEEYAAVKASGLAAEGCTFLNFPSLWDGGDLLASLQQAHDWSIDQADMIRRLRIVADQRGLEQPDSVHPDPVAVTDAVSTNNGIPT